MYTMNINEVCMALNLGRTKIYSLIREGELKAKKIGKRTVILKEDVEAFLQNLEEYPTKPGN